MESKTKPSGALTPPEIRGLRLECLRLVMGNGSNLDKTNPTPKAKELYSYISTGIVKEKP